MVVDGVANRAKHATHCPVPLSQWSGESSILPDDQQILVV
jgi:hypothetical protein